MDEKKVKILLVEDNPGDVRLVHEALKNSKLAVDLYIARDGEEAMSFLRREDDHKDVPMPDLIILDLNLPKKDGREVLAEVKADSRLKRIPVVVMTSSKADEDVEKCYKLHANCYISKPVDLDLCSSIVQNIEDFWFTIVKLPEE
ncbi:MAG: response regulator [Planctomycetes bacterium]|nr:response regulator [Planctomycetota bacterium]